MACGNYFTKTLTCMKMKKKNSNEFIWQKRTKIVIL